MSPTLPADYARIRVVHSFQELATTPFSDGVNALCWPRVLPGNFREVADQLTVEPGITTLDEAELQTLRVSSAGHVAITTLLADQNLLRSLGLSPVLDCVEGSEPEEDSRPVRTDVHSFHADSATVEADTWLCTYLGAPSEGLQNDQAIRRVDIPQTRAELLRLYGGADDAGFRQYLNENYFDLHYAPVPPARPFSFGQGHLWRIAVEYPGCPVPPCIHRAPLTLPGQPRRLLLIS